MIKATEKILHFIVSLSINLFIVFGFLYCLEGNHLCVILIGLCILFALFETSIARKTD